MLIIFIRFETLLYAFITFFHNCVNFFTILRSKIWLLQTFKTFFLLFVRDIILRSIFNFCVFLYVFLYFHSFSQICTTCNILFYHEKHQSFVLILGDFIFFSFYHHSSKWLQLHKNGKKSLPAQYGTPATIASRGNVLCDTSSISSSKKSNETSINVCTFLTSHSMSSILAAFFVRTTRRRWCRFRTELTML